MKKLSKLNREMKPVLLLVTLTNILVTTIWVLGTIIQRYLLGES